MTDEPDRTRLRSIFNTVAERYGRIRPRYPASLFEDIERLGRLGPGSHVLEIGCGTGQATVDLARRAYRVSRSRSATSSPPSLAGASPVSPTRK